MGINRTTVSKTMKRYAAVRAKNAAASVRGSLGQILASLGPVRPRRAFSVGRNVVDDPEVVARTAANGPLARLAFAAQSPDIVDLILARFAAPRQ